MSDRPLSVSGYKLESGDRFVLSDDKLTLTYRFANYGHIDGLDFRTACATKLRVRGSMAGEKLPVGRIWIGRAGTHPLSNPFLIETPALARHGTQRGTSLGTMRRSRPR